MKFSLKQLEAFVWVADLGSFVKTAERLNTTQPNISARISALEDVLKCCLLERDAGSVRLTNKGKSLHQHAKKVLKACEELVEATDEPELYDGILRLGVTEMVVHTWLRDFLRIFKERYPQAIVELTVDLSVNISRDLSERSIDLALQSGPFGSHVGANNAYASRTLGTYPQVWVAHPTICNLVGDKPTLANMCEHNILTHARGTILFDQVSKHFKGNPTTTARIVPSSNLAACLHMTMDGMGIASLPKAMVVKELAAEELKTITYSWAPDNLNFSARFYDDTSNALVKMAADIAVEAASM